MRRFLSTLPVVLALVAVAHAAPADYPALDAPMPAAKTGAALSAVEFFKQTAPSIYLIVAAKDDDALKHKDIDEGSAVAISPTLALTNCHIVNKRPTLVLIQKKEKDTGVTVVASDPRTDRCVIAAQTMKLHPIAGVRSYRDIAVGEKVFTIGNPSGLVATLSEGIVSGLRTQRGVRYVQTSAPISPGSSGGGLFDENGNLLGITSFKIDDAENLNFAIAAEDYWRKAGPKKRRSRKDDADE